MQKHEVLDFVCVIHGDLYSWEYVEKLYSMLGRHLPLQFRFNVFTEAQRTVPSHVIKHDLTEWPGVGGKRSAWWYKMQIFDPSRKLGRVMYLDLDTVVVNDLGWINELDPQFFWTIRDFKYLWRPNWQGINSSFMLFDSARYSFIWQDFYAKNVHQVSKQFRGDQDYLSQILDQKNLRFLDPIQAMSWRWQVFQGGFDIKKRQCRSPNHTTTIPNGTSLLVFHGEPKPHTVQDWVVQQHWV